MENPQAHPALEVSVEQVEAELELLQTQKRSWVNNLVTLAFSLILFAGAGLFKATFFGVMIVVFVLFIHELGHFIGMKIFRYREVQMFFIPFFGAAVRGSETKPSGAKRAIISLLGPLPGIVLGVICGVLYFLSATAALSKSGVVFYQPAQEIYAELARTFLFINAFNLLPLSPLDGGRVLEDVLFSRSAKIALVFQVLAFLAFAGLALALKDVVLGILAFISVISLKLNYFINLIAIQLRREIPNDEAYAREHPPKEHLERIIVSLQNKLPEAHKTPPLFAKYAQAIWQEVRYRPPRVWGALALLLLYFFSLLGGIFSTFALESGIQLLIAGKFQGERAWEMPADDAKIEASILKFRPMLYADMSLKEVALASRGDHQVINAAMTLIDSGEVRQAHEKLDSARVDSAARANPRPRQLRSSNADFFGRRITDLRARGRRKTVGVCRWLGARGDG